MEKEEGREGCDGGGSSVSENGRGRDVDSVEIVLG